ncbi:MAG: alpha/beta fold hydrolase [Vicinamibacterales bacterium]
MRSGRSHPQPWRLAAVALAVAALWACDRPGDNADDRLAPCGIDEGPTDAYCGGFEVFENRAAAAGRRIRLKIVVLPALSNSPKPDPVVLLAGGPGQGAARMARQVRGMFRRMQADRDILLVDQRGTGDSNGLECAADDDSLAQLNESEEATLARLRACLAGYDADVRFYTTDLAMDDLDDVRAWLGYEQLNIYGGSYGTRAGLVYLRQHEDRVRAIVLDGVAPPDMRLPTFFARDAQRALDKLIADCEASAGCATRAPGPRRADASALRAARDGAADGPARAPAHGRRGRRACRCGAGGQHHCRRAVLAAHLVHRARAHRARRARRLPWPAGAGDDGESDVLNMSAGMQLSVICAEDEPRIEAGDLDRASAGSVFASHLVAGRLEACRFWPRGSVPADYYEPVTSDGLP